MLRQRFGAIRRTPETTVTDRGAGSRSAQGALGFIRTPGTCHSHFVLAPESASQTECTPACLAYGRAAHIGMAGPVGDLVATGQSRARPVGRNEQLSALLEIEPRLGRVAMPLADELAWVGVVIAAAPAADDRGLLIAAEVVLGEVEQ